MAVSFMVIGLPRSGTTWAANWLTTNASLCFHDPLWHTHYRDWDQLGSPARLVGVSCTGIWRWPEWVNRHPARKLVLRRDIAEVQDSLGRLGVSLESHASRQLDRVQGMACHWTELFDPVRAEQIWRHLLVNLPFDAARHRALMEYRIEPRLEAIQPDLLLTRQLMQELAHGARSDRHAG